MLTIPHPYGTQCATALAGLLGTATPPDASAGNTVLAQLNSELAKWNTAATAYNSTLAGAVDLATATAAVIRAVDAIKQLSLPHIQPRPLLITAPFIEPDPHLFPDPDALFWARFAAAQHCVARSQHADGIRQALAGAADLLRQTQAGIAVPSDVALMSACDDAANFSAYLSATL